MQINLSIQEALSLLYTFITSIFFCLLSIGLYNVKIVINSNKKRKKKKPKYIAFTNAFINAVVGATFACALSAFLDATVFKFNIWIHFFFCMIFGKISENLLDIFTETDFVNSTGSKLRDGATKFLLDKMEKEGNTDTTKKLEEDGQTDSTKD